MDEKLYYEDLFLRYLELHNEIINSDNSQDLVSKMPMITLLWKNYLGITEPLKTKPKEIQSNIEEGAHRKQDDTNIAVLNDDTKTEQIKTEEEHGRINTIDDIFDFSLSNDYRIQVAESVYLQEPDVIIEVINKLRSIHSISNVYSIRSFLYDIALHSSLPIDLRVICADALCQSTKVDETICTMGLECMYLLCKEIQENKDLLTTFGCPIPISQYVQLLVFLIKHSNEHSIEESIEKSYDLFTKFIENIEIDCFFRYKTIISVEKFTITKNFCKIFINNLQNDMRYRIIACQNILLSCDQESTLFKETLDLLIDIAQNTNNPDNRRADAADIILHSVKDNTKRQIAEDIITQLGSLRKGSSIFENSQNVHTVTLGNSSLDIIHYLFSGNFKSKLDFDSIVKELLFIAKLKYRHTQTFGTTVVYHGETSEEELLIKKALDRISVDKTLFTHNLTLKTVLIMLHAYIDDSCELKARLLEELIEMSDTCSSGYISRLANTLSGFSDMSLKISWEEQIIANLNGRLNARIRLENEELRDEILRGLTCTDMSERRPFLEFFQKNISSIRTELYDEFKAFMSDTDFDLYCTKAIINYEQ